MRQTYPFCVICDVELSLLRQIFVSPLSFLAQNATFQTMHVLVLVCQCSWSCVIQRPASMSGRTHVVSEEDYRMLVQFKQNLGVITQALKNETRRAQNSQSYSCKTSEFLLLYRLSVSQFCSGNSHDRARHCYPLSHPLFPLPLLILPLLSHPLHAPLLKQLQSFCNGLHLSLRIYLKQKQTDL